MREVGLVLVLAVRPLRLAQTAARLSVATCLIAGSLAGGICLALPAAASGAIDEFNGSPGEMVERLPRALAQVTGCFVPGYLALSLIFVAVHFLSDAKHNPLKRQRLRVGLLAPVTVVLWGIALAAAVMVGGMASARAYSPGSRPPDWIRPWVFLESLACLLYPALGLGLFLLLVRALSDKGVAAELSGAERCWECGYDLSGLDRNVCPECGGPVKPETEAPT